VQIDADPDPVPDADPGYQNNADPDPHHCCLLTITSVVDLDIELIGLDRSNQTNLSTGLDLTFFYIKSKSHAVYGIY
jgi:hypothetical protein